MSSSQVALAAVVAVLGGAAVARAQDEINVANPIGLGWTECSVANPVGVKLIGFGCDAEAANACRVFRLLPTFVSTITVANFAGSITTIDILVGSSSTVGEWWTGLVPGGCRVGPAISTVGNITAAGSCANPYPVPAATLPGQQAANNVGTNPAPNRFRIQSANSVDPVQPLTTGTRTYAMQLEFKTEGTLADCDPSVDNTPLCTSGCASPACLVLNDVSIFMLVDGNPTTPDIIHYYDDWTPGRSFCWYQSSNLNCFTPTRASTWGEIKALYR